MKLKQLLVLSGMIMLTGCTTLRDALPAPNADQIAQSFFEDLQELKNQKAYGLLGRGLCQRVSFDQFDQLMQTLREEWGRIDSYDTETLPFHQRPGEKDFIPLGVPEPKVRHYTFDVKFDNAEMNFDLTLAPEGDGYKIVWFSIWGSSIYMKPDIQEKIEKLFTGAEGPSQ